MGKSLYGKYLDSKINKGVYLNLCIASEVWFSMIYHFQDILFFHFPIGDEGTGKYDEKEVLMSCYGFSQMKWNVKNTYRGSLQVNIGLGYFGVHRIQLNSF